MNIYKVEERYPVLNERCKYTQSKLKEIRKELENTLSRVKNKDQFSLITTGSYGRLEASEESDIDLFLIYDDDLDESTLKEITKKLSKVILKAVPVQAGSTGTFGIDTNEKISNLVENIGGQQDDNSKFTRRMLFLLEGKWLFNKDKFENYRTQLLEKYIKEDIPDHQLNKFFLNDIIRYYRTIATDFEYKVSEKEQSWGLRNIKLRFSRKLLYFGGIIVVAETSHKTRSEKIETTKQLLDMSPLERIEKLSNVTPDNIFIPYETFLKQVSDKSIRDLLKSVDKDKRNECEEFKSLRNLGHHFSWALSLWLTNHYDSGHPIHHSLLF